LPEADPPDALLPPVLAPPPAPPAPANAHVVKLKAIRKRIFVFIGYFFLIVTALPMPR
jgi:hypothetical protein